MFRAKMKTMCVLAVLGWASALSAAGQWPQFRGPGGAGIGAGDSIGVSFTEADYRWKVTLPGPGHSSPVVWGDRIFLTCVHDEDQQREVVCLDAESGKQLWSVKYPFKPYKQNRLNSFAASTPAVDADHVYINWISGDQFVALALDHAGNKLWRREMGRFKAKHGAGASPVALNGLMIVANDNQATSFLAGLDGKTGKTVWQIKRSSKKTSYSTPLIYRPEGGDLQVIFVSEAYGLTAVDPATGRLIWESERLFTLKSVASPVLAGDLIFATAGSGGGGKESAAVRPGNHQAGRGPSVVWSQEEDLPYIPTPIAVGKHLYIVSEAGIISCVESATGKQVWRQDMETRFYASPVCVNEKIYLVTRKGEMIVLQAGPEYKQLARNILGEESDATPAIVNGRMYIRTLNHLICIGQ
ncbi:MAG: PQQ-binding-like beta-propeller repeat protein [Planctomycetota bacterium]|jgi:outer membrane protein assembly factor BamB